MKINLEFAELHNVLFLGGKNFGLKLNKKNLTGLDLVYDQSEKELWVTFGGKTAIIPSSNVASMTPEPARAFVSDGEPLDVSPNKDMEEQVKVTARKKMTAQVSTPHGHVFAGEGQGVTRDR